MALLVGGKWPLATLTCVLYLVAQFLTYDVMIREGPRTRTKVRLLAARIPTQIMPPAELWSVWVLNFKIKKYYFLMVINDWKFEKLCTMIDIVKSCVK